ncbi:high-affinity nicotinic acid transporter [Flagelloscypha sp. PMI_526]|nr:high-affinity nicotinic acid transporter [Flagelloscypha sp. PMI_526]
MAMLKEDLPVVDAEKASVASFENIDIKAERRLIRRIDFRILPLMSLLYAFALIDRTNLGLARVAGMAKDLELTIGSRYSLISCVYFIPYILLQLPSNLALRRLGPRNWLTICVIGWGVVQIGMSFVKTWQQLAGCRVLLGAFEAGFFPAMVFIISTWYTRQEVQKRMAAFYLTATIFNGFSTILAYGLTLLGGKGGLKSWQWIFVIEGVIPAALGFLAFFYLPHFPDKNNFLKPEETKYVLNRIEEDRGDALPDQLAAQKVLAHLKDWTIIAHALMLMSASMPAYVVSFFITVILKSMGFTAEKAYLLSAPPFVAAALSCLFFAWITDKTLKRALFMAIQACMTIIGASLVGFAGPNSVRYLGIFLTIMGATGCIPNILAYNANNVVSHTKRAVSTAIMTSFAGMGGIIATTVFRERDAPGYRPGLWATIACQILLLALLACTSIAYRIRNAAANRGERILEGQAGFRYTL